jgi:hypothetical protein
MHMEHLSTIIYIYSLILHTKNYIKKKKQFSTRLVSGDVANYHVISV